MHCELCQIVSGARPVPVVHESATTIAFVDRDPSAPGLVVVVPRRHVPELRQLTDGAMGSFLASLVEVIERVTETLRPDRLAVSWTEVGGDASRAEHVHVRLVPEFLDDASRVGATGGALDQHLTTLAPTIRREPVESRRAGPSRLVPRRLAALARLRGPADR